MATDRAEVVRQHLLAFMDRHVYPNEERYREQLDALPDRFTTVPLMEELKAEARAAGLWNRMHRSRSGSPGRANEKPLTPRGSSVGSGLEARRTWHQPS